MVTIKLYKPIEFEGEKITEITMDLEGLTGADMLSIERESTVDNQINMARELTKEYQILTAARASKRPKEMFLLLSARDFSRVTIAVQNFFVVEESEAMEEVKEEAQDEQ